MPMPRRDIIEGAVAVLQLEIGLAKLVVCLSGARVDLNGLGILNHGISILALIEIMVANLNEVLGDGIRRLLGVGLSLARFRRPSGLQSLRGQAPVRPWQQGCLQQRPQAPGGK